jgi:hypothetical protein
MHLPQIIFCRVTNGFIPFTYFPIPGLLSFIADDFTDKVNCQHDHYKLHSYLLLDLPNIFSIKKPGRFATGPPVHLIHFLLDHTWTQLGRLWMLSFTSAMESLLLSACTYQ